MYLAGRRLARGDRPLIYRRFLLLGFQPRSDIRQFPRHPPRSQVNTLWELSGFLQSMNVLAREWDEFLHLVTPQQLVELMQWFDHESLRHGRTLRPVTARSFV